jgi:hypothetical protein
MRRLMLAILSAIGVIASLILVVGQAPAQAASSGTTVSQRPDSPDSTGCLFAVANLNYRYYGPNYDRGLVWSSVGPASGNAVELGYKKSSSSLDCFKALGGFGNDEFEYEQYDPPGLCLNVAGNSYTAGAWIILYACVSTANERFIEYGTSYGIQLQSASSGLCVDLTNGLNPYSILDQEPCGNPGDIYQEWYPASS